MVKIRLLYCVFAVPSLSDVMFKCHIIMESGDTSPLPVCAWKKTAYIAYDTADKDMKLSSCMVA